MTYAERVAAGALFLDEHVSVPSNWRSLIDVETLDLTESEFCVLGQLVGAIIPDFEYDKFGDDTYVMARNALNLEHEDAADRGFIYTSEEYAMLRTHQAYLGLTKAWKSYLSAA